MDKTYLKIILKVQLLQKLTTYTHDKTVIKKSITQTGNQLN